MKLRYFVLYAACCLMMPNLTAVAHAAVPGQFIAKMYTEALGRAPDPDGWTAYVNFFTQNGCSLSTLKVAGEAFYTSTEYDSLAYDDVEKVLTLYRGALNREPDSNGLNYWVYVLSHGVPFSPDSDGVDYWRYLLGRGTPFSVVVDSLFSSSEFAGNVPSICNGDGSIYARSYGWSGDSAIAVPIKGPGFNGTASELQSMLDSTPPGGTVFLAQRAFIATDSTIMIPVGVTLATTGTPDPVHYARMGRIVRNSLFQGAVVQLESGAQLLSVWVSGQRNVVGYFFGNGGDGVNIFLDSGQGSQLLNSRTDSPAGFTTVLALGMNETGFACQNAVISGNLSTGYTSHHTVSAGGGWADGISNACEGATITNNSIVDATDVGIVLYRSDPATQRSQITNNVIVSAGLSAYGALVADPVNDTPKADYAGSLVSGNQLWTSDATHFDIAISVGTLPWFSGVGGTVGTGANFQNNSTPNGLRANVNTGILIDGMLDATVQGNTLAMDLVQVSQCPSGYVLADSISNSHSGGNLQTYTPAVAHDCIGH